MPSWTSWKVQMANPFENSLNSKLNTDIAPKKSDEMSESVHSREDATSSPRWISLMDYAMKTGLSLSTLRRYIKAKKVPYRVENGRYLLLEPHLSETQGASPHPSESTAQSAPSGAPQNGFAISGLIGNTDSKNPTNSDEVARLSTR